MAKDKKAAKQVATPVASSDQKAAKQVAKSSSSAPKKTEKKAEPKPKLETKQVCFTDQETGKRFCGEVTEVPKGEGKAKVGAIPPRRRKRRV